MNGNFKRNSRYDKERAGGAPKREVKAPQSYADEQVSEGTVFGRNAVRELLTEGRDVEKIYIQRGDREGSINQLIGLASERKIPIVELDKQKLDRMCAGGRHQGIVAMASLQDYASVEDILAYAEERGEKPFIVLCDGIEDPHNLGAIIRTAECSGVHGVIIPKRRAVGLTSTVAKSSAGALSHMRIAKVTNLAVTLDELKERGLWAYAADMDGTDYRSTDMRGGAVIVLGSEGFGISRLVKEKCDFVVSIKMYGQVNSMNVSCAAAVILTEVAHQRNN
jgi:23S rRNA (guanosine2251-2'-O)-methyltransferase